MSSSPLPQKVLESIRHPVVSHNSYSLSPPFSAVSWNERRPKIDAHIPEWNSKSGDRPCSRLSKKPDQIPTWNSKMLEGRRRGRGGRWSSRRPPSHDWFWRSEAWAAKQNNTWKCSFYVLQKGSMRVVILWQAFTSTFESYLHVPPRGLEQWEFCHYSTS